MPDNTIKFTVYDIRSYNNEDDEEYPTFILQAKVSYAEMIESIEKVSQKILL
jgi:hypothetical protein